MLQNNLKAKRKAPDGEGATDATMSTTNNPLLNAAKRAKREAKGGASKKRKLLNGEEQPGGLLIIRAPPAPTTAPAASTKPPSKKFKSSQPSNSQPQPFTSKPSSTSPFLPSSSYPTSRHDTPDADPALDDAVRAMQDEAAHLRRSSRGPAHAHALNDDDSSGLNPKLRFPGATVNGVAVTTKGKGSSGTGTGKRRETIVDMSAPLPPEGDETPQIQRNKRLRAGAMAELAAGNSNGSMSMGPKTPSNGSSSSGSGTGTGSSYRRKSSVGRGKRISSSFQSTGVISQPHNSVSDASFYKHIDADLPDAERVRQLLIWCSARASSSSSSSAPAPSPLPLPALSAQAAQALRAAQDDIVRKIAERRVDLSLYGGPEVEDGGEGEKKKKKENAQNVTNRVWEGVYGGHIKSAMEEEEAWKKFEYAYDTYARRVQTSLEKRRAALLTTTTTTTTATSPPEEEEASVPPSAKAQGKQRATINSKFELHEHELPQPFQAGVRMARTVLARTRRRRPEPDPAAPATPGAGPSTSTSTSTRKGADPDSRRLPTAAEHALASYDVDVDVDMLPPEAGRSTVEDAEWEREGGAGDVDVLRSRVGEVEFKLDHLYVLASQARATAEVARLALDRRFEVLARALDARSEAPRGGDPEGEGMGRYLRTGTGSAGGGDAGRQADEALQLLRAMARVDAARPPAQVGDAARRAMREVQRVGESGVGAVGSRRLTGVPPPGVVGVTPRKMPGTPRRGTTPSRDRERER